MNFDSFTPAQPKLSMIYLPIYQSIRRPRIRLIIKKKTNIKVALHHTQIERNAQFTLGKLLELKVMDFTSDIVGISNEATQEMGLEELMEKVNNKVFTHPLIYSSHGLNQ